MSSGLVFFWAAGKVPLCVAEVFDLSAQQLFVRSGAPGDGPPRWVPAMGPCMIWASFRGLPARAMLEGLGAACRVPGAQSRLPPPPLPPLSGNFAFSAGARSLAGSRSLRRTAGEGGAAWEPELGGFSVDLGVLRPVVRRGAPGGGPLGQPLSRGSSDTATPS